MLEEFSFLQPAAFAQAIAKGYLPSVEGIGHTWTCLLYDVRIAVISTSRIQPLVAVTPFAGCNRVHFAYRSATY